MRQSDYHFRERAGADSSSPVLVVFHGTGGDENQFFDIGLRLLPGARLIAPRGDVDERGALRYFRRTAEGVYDMEDLAARTRRMADFLREKLPEEKPKLFGLGYSNGANILANLVFTAPGLFDAVVLMHPLIPFDPPEVALDGRSVLVTAGHRDPIAPEPATRRLVDWLAAHGAEVETVWHEGGHELRREELAAAAAFLAKVNAR